MAVVRFPFGLVSASSKTCSAAFRQRAARLGSVLWKSWKQSAKAAASRPARLGLIGLPGGAGAEHRAVADVARGRVAAAVGVVGLRQAPDVVVAERLCVALADAHLVVQRAAAVVEHAQQPFHAEARLGREVRARRGRAHLCGEVAHAGQQQVDGVAGRLHELQVVAGVPPASGGVDRFAGRREVAFEDAVAVDLRRREHARRLVVEVGRRRAQRRGDVLRPVALVLVERQRVGQRLFIQRGGRGDRERRRAGAGLAADAHRVAARRLHGVEVQRVHEAVAIAPRAQRRADRSAQRRRAGAGGLHRKRRAGLRDARHQVRALGRRGGIADLVDANRRDWRRRGARARGRRTVRRTAAPARTAPSASPFCSARPSPIQPSRQRSRAVRLSGGGWSASGRAPRRAPA